MNFPFFIARRFFSTKRKSNFVHIISLISLIGVAVGTAGLILVLSVFNGFENLVLSMYNSFDPHLKITSTQGKTFNPDLIKENILGNSNVEVTAFVLEEKVLLKYQEKEFIAIVKGVSENYQKLTNFDSLLIDGNYITEYGHKNVAVIGAGIAYYLSMGLGAMFDHLQVFLPNRNSTTLLNHNTAFKQSSVLPVGIFRIQAEIDQEYIITPLKFIQQLSEKENEISAIEIKLKAADKMLLVQEQLKKVLGVNYIVKNRLEQQVFLYKILNTEKLAVFLILVFIMIIATFNIVGSLSMLMLDKKDDILSLKSFGTSKKQIQHIFFNTSMLTIISAAIGGLLIGVTLGLLQQSFGFVGMGGGNFIIDAYPVAFSTLDILLVFVTVIIIGSLASWYPSKALTNRLFRK
ncbi:ABC transporter permease [Flavobacteriales bacterium]|nr:ABC transporter permease [Flavobacteriales bacterium]